MLFPVILRICLLVFVSVTEFEGKVISVIDGDTIEVLKEGRTVRIRLNGIDCPEQKQAFGAKAKKFAAELLFNNHVKVVVKDIDRYGRSVADVYLADGTWINKKLVEAGFAWHYKRYSSSKELSDAELHARKSKAGLWQDATPIEPWTFRSNARK